VEQAQACSLSAFDKDSPTIGQRFFDYLEARPQKGVQLFDILCKQCAATAISNSPSSSHADTLTRRTNCPRQCPFSGSVGIGDDGRVWVDP